MKKQTCKIWKTIKLGTKPDLSDIEVSSYAQDILDKVTYSKTKEKVDLVKIALSDWFTECPTITEIYAKAKEEGLDLCPAEVGPQLRAVYKDQSDDEWLYIAMDPITDSGGDPGVFELSRRGGGRRWLYGRWARPGGRWGLDDGFVFRLRKSLRHYVPSLALSSFGTLSLEKRVKALEKIVKKLTRVINI